MRHVTHRMHDNSLDAYHGEQEKLGRRAQIVLDWIKAHGPCTDRDVMRGLGFTDMNTVRPRVTELIDAGFVEEIATKAVCPVTKRHVRLVRAVIEPRQQEMFAT